MIDRYRAWRERNRTPEDLKRHDNKIVAWLEANSDIDVIVMIAVILVLVGGMIVAAGQK